jgi:hypothetical protein
MGLEGIADHVAIEDHPAARFKGLAAVRPCRGGMASRRLRLAPGTRMPGFCSGDEIAPNGASRTPQLHNQTMTVTTMHEIAA